MATEKNFKVKKGLDVLSGAVSVTNNANSSAYADLTIFHTGNLEVGRIAYTANDNLQIGGSAANHAGLNFIQNAVKPMAALSETNNAIDIGDSTHKFRSLYLTTNIDAGNFQLNAGTVKISTETNAKPLEISRSGSSASQVMKIGVQDTIAKFNYIEDTTNENGNFGQYQFILGGNDNESSVIALKIQDDNLEVPGDITVGGDLNVTGTVNTSNTTELLVQDRTITLNYGTGDTSGTSDGSGIIIQDAVDASTNASIIWDNDTSNEFDFSHGIGVAGNVTATGYNIGNLNSDDDIGQQLEYGNASVATLRFDSDRWGVYAGGGSTTGEKLTVLESGNVGIGEDNPVQKLQVNGNIYSHTGHFYVDTNNYLVSVGDLHFGSNNDTTTPKMAILSGGNVGIGTDTPSAQFHVQTPSGSPTIAWSDLSNARALFGTTTLGIGIDDNEIAGKGGDLFIGTIDSDDDLVLRAGGASNRLVVKGDTGNVGIGTLTPGHSRFRVAGEANLSSFDGYTNFKGAMLTKLFGNELLHGHKWGTVTSSGVFLGSSQENVFKPGDNYSYFSSSTGTDNPVQWTIEASNLVSVSSNVGVRKICIAVHNTGFTCDLKLEIKNASGVYETCYDDSFTFTGGAQFDLFGLANIFYNGTASDDWPIGGLRVTIDNYGTDTRYISQIGIANTRFDNRAKCWPFIGTDGGRIWDGDELSFGNSNDLKIYHDGSNSYIKDSGTGDLRILGANNISLGNLTFSETYLNATVNGAVELYYDNDVTLETTADGIDVTGSVSATTTVSTGEFTLPNAAGTAGQILKWPSSGTTLEWASDEIDDDEFKIQVGDTKVEVSDTGTDGKVETTVDNVLISTTGDNGITMADGKDFIGDLRGSVLFRAKVDQSGGLAKGQVVYIKGLTGGETPDVAQADADDAAKMPAFGVVRTSANDNAEVIVYTFGTLTGIKTNYSEQDGDGNTVAWAEGDELYVSTAPGTSHGMTIFPPTGSTSQLQKIGKILRVHGTNGTIKIIGAGRTNATPNLDEGKIFVGNASNQSVQVDNTINVDMANSRVDVTGRLHVKGPSTLGAEYTPTTYADVIIEDEDAHLEIVSSSDATWGSSILLKEHHIVADDTDTINIWAISRQTEEGTGDGTLRINYGTANDHNINGTKLTLDQSGNLTLVGYTTAPTFRATNSAMLRRYVSGWGANLKQHDVVYNGYQSNLGDFTYLKAAGNNATGHGMIIAADLGTYFGQTNIETGTLADHATDPITNVWGFFKDATAYAKGNLGVGTKTPQQKLQVNGNIYLGPNDSYGKVIHSGNSATLSADTNLYFVMDANDTTGDLDDSSDAAIIFGGGSNIDTNATANFSLAQYNTDALSDPHYRPRVELMRITNSGQVGIGTDDPDRKLHIEGSGSTIAVMVEATDGNQASVDLKNSEGEHRLISDGGEFAIYDQGENTERFRIDSTGQVGIGTNDPQNALHLKNATGPIIRFESTDTQMQSGDIYGALSFWGSDNSSATSDELRAYIQVSPPLNSTSGAADIIFATTKDNQSSPLQKMKITGRGSVHIGDSIVNDGMPEGSLELSAANDYDLDSDGSVDTGPIFRMTNKMTTLADGDRIGQIQWKASDSRNDGNKVVAFMDVRNEEIDVNGTDLPNPKFVLGLMNNNNSSTTENATGRLTIHSDGKAVFTNKVLSDYFGGQQYPNNSYLDFDNDLCSPGSAGSNATSLHSVAQMDFIIDSNNNGTTDAYTWMRDVTTGSTVSATNDARMMMRLNQAGDGTNVLTVFGDFEAETKSFDIAHPTKEGKRLHHGVLEGPEHAVYVRGRSSGGVIELPDYWTGLVHEHTITVQLTPIGYSTALYVKDIVDNTVEVQADCEYFYFVQAERKDVDRFDVEYEVH